MARTNTLAKDVFSGIRESIYCGCMVGGLMPDQSAILPEVRHGFGSLRVFQTMLTLVNLRLYLHATMAEWKCLSHDL